MNTGSMFGFMDLIVIGCGVYGIYSWYKLVKEHEIKKAYLVGGTSQPSDCKDVPAFADFMGTKLLILSLGMIIFGGVSAINDYVQSVGAIIWVLMAIFLALIIWYCVQLRKADQMFFSKTAKTGNTIKNKALNKK